MIPMLLQKEFDDSGWEDIQIPHDFSMDQEFSVQYEQNPVSFREERDGTAKMSYFQEIMKERHNTEL